MILDQVKMLSFLGPIQCLILLNSSIALHCLSEYYYVTNNSQQKSKVKTIAFVIEAVVVITIGQSSYHVVFSIG